jgi:hypothetical protein
MRPVYPGGDGLREGAMWTTPLARSFANGDKHLPPGAQALAVE